MLRLFLNLNIKQENNNFDLSEFSHFLRNKLDEDHESGGKQFFYSERIKNVYFVTFNRYSIYNIKFK